MSTSVALDLLSNASASGSAVMWPGGMGEFSVEASAWNGATVALHKEGPNGTYVSLGADVTLTANGFGAFVAGGGNIKAVITGSPTGVYAKVRGI